MLSSFIMFLFEKSGHVRVVFIAFKCTLNKRRKFSFSGCCDRGSKPVLVGSIRHGIVSIHYLLRGMFCIVGFQLMRCFHVAQHHTRTPLSTVMCIHDSSCCATMTVHDELSFCEGVVIRIIHQKCC